MIIKSLFCTIVLLFSVQTIQAKTLLVSDIDDTVKMTGVLGRTAHIIFNGLFREKAFAGMSELYQEIARNGTDIYYVSGSPKIIRSRVDDFLEENDFPQERNLILKNKLSDDTTIYKINTIRTLINKLKPDEVILIGDDTEFDPEVYTAISKEYPNLVKAVYIRAVRNRANIKTKFFSPVEIAGLEILSGRLSLDSLSKVTYGFINQTEDSGIALKSHYCPKEGRAEIEDLRKDITDKGALDLLRKAQDKIIKSCKKR